MYYFGGSKGGGIFYYAISKFNDKNTLFFIDLFISHQIFIQCNLQLRFNFQ